MITPIRIHRSRVKGSRMVSPNGLPIVCVTRPGRWGNPLKIGDPFPIGGYCINGRIHTGFIQDAAQAVHLFRDRIQYSPEFILDIKREFKDKNTSCWCHIWECQKCKEFFDIDGGFDNPPWCGPCKSFMTRVPCHGDVYLRIANEP